MKFGCTCGATISDTTDFLPYKGYVLADQDFEDCRLDSPSDFMHLLRTIYQCEQCGRLWIDDGPHVPMKSFAPESGIERVLSSHLGAAWKAPLIGNWRARGVASHPLGELYCPSASRGQVLYQGFDRWEDLEVAYHREFAARRAAGTLRSAFLSKNAEVIHSWSFSR